MRWLRLRAGVWPLAGAAVAMLAAACGVAGVPTSAAPGPAPIHRISTMRLTSDDRARDRGVLAYSKLSTVPVGQAIWFDVEVADAGPGQGHNPFARQASHWLVAPNDIPVAGAVSVRIICSTRVTCTPRSPGAQLITGPGRSAAWRWQVAARSPGEARILLVVTSYGHRAGHVLRRTTVTAYINVRATPLYLLKSYLGTRKAAALGLGAGAVAVVVALGVVLDRRRRQPDDTTAAGQSPGTELSADATEPMRSAAGHALPAGVPAGRTGPGWKVLLWLAAAGAVAGVAAAWAAYASTRAPLAVMIAVVPGAAAAVPLYCLPMIIAYRRSAPDRASVTVINVLLGWTYVGWVAALALAARDRRPCADVSPVPGAAPGPGTLREPGTPAKPGTARAAGAAGKPGAAPARPGGNQAPSPGGEPDVSPAERPALL
jgi:hypothetical protein